MNRTPSNPNMPQSRPAPPSRIGVRPDATPPKKPSAPPPKKLVPPPARRRPPAFRSASEDPGNTETPPLQSSVSVPSRIAPPPRVNLPTQDGTGLRKPPPQRPQTARNIQPTKVSPPARMAPPPKVNPKDIPPPVTAPRVSAPLSRNVSASSVPKPKLVPQRVTPPAPIAPLSTAVEEEQKTTKPTLTRTSSFEKAQPSGKQRVSSSLGQTPSNLSPQRSAPSPERRNVPIAAPREPIAVATTPIPSPIVSKTETPSIPKTRSSPRMEEPPTFAATSRPEPSKSLADSQKILNSTKAEISTTKGQVIIAEKNFLLACSSGLQAYSSNPDLSRHDKDNLFSNMDCIISAHTEVLANMNDSNTASDFLFSLVPHLQLYLPYIANLTNALTTLNDLRDRGVFFDTTKGVVSVQSIENLLERPKQHLADYPATIAGLMDNTDPSDPEHARLSQVLTAFETIQRQINKRDVLPKHLRHLWDIEQSFDQKENLQLGSDTELYQEGYAVLVSSSANRTKGEKLRVLIFRGLVIIAALQEDGYTWGSLLKSTLDNLTVKDTEEFKNGLEFISGNVSVSLSTFSGSVKRLWMNYVPVQYPNGRKPLQMTVEL